MPELLVDFDAYIEAQDGSRWLPRVWGRICEDALWEGWIEFMPAGTDDREAIRTGRETEQPKRVDLMYWAQGLTQVYLEGALERAIRQSRRNASASSGAMLPMPERRDEPERPAIRPSRR